MSDLEELGLIYSPHTSAGRLPTQLGLRFFVDAFMEIGDLSEQERRNIETQLKGAGADASLTDDPSGPWTFDYVVYAPGGPVADFAPFERIKAVSGRFLISEPVQNWTHGNALLRGLARRGTRVGPDAETFRFDEASLRASLEALRGRVGFRYRVIHVARDMIVEVLWSS